MPRANCNVYAQGANVDCGTDHPYPGCCSGDSTCSKPLTSSNYCTPSLCRAVSLVEQMPPNLPCSTSSSTIISHMPCVSCLNGSRLLQHALHSKRDFRRIGRLRNSGEWPGQWLWHMSIESILACLSCIHCRHVSMHNQEAWDEADLVCINCLISLVIYGIQV